MEKIFAYVVPALILLSCNQEKPEAKEPANHNLEVSSGEIERKTEFQKIENLPAGLGEIFGKEPSKEIGFYKFSFPRKDLSVKLNNVTINPRLAFTTWFAFLPSKDSNEAMLMGDLVLLETEFPTVLKKLQEHNIDVVAIHNHLLDEKPKVMYMHVGGMGNPVETTKRLKDVLSATATPINAALKNDVQNVYWGKTEEIMGYKGKKEGELLKFGVARKERITDHGMELPSNYGINSVINFQKVGDKAAITGDFVLVRSEVDKVVEILTDGGITVTALHNHMIFEEPRLFFMHFWAVDDPEKLAKSLNQVLTSTNHEPVK